MLRAPSTLALLLCLAAAFPTEAFAAGPTVVVVDLRRAFTETKEGKNTLTKLKKEFDKRQADLDRRQQDLLKWKEELMERIKLMTPETRQEKQAEFQQRMQALMEHYQKLQDEMTKREEKLSKPIIEKIEKALLKIAEDEKFDVILHKGAVVWARNALDITDQLVRRYERTK